MTENTSRPYRGAEIISGGVSAMNTGEHARNLTDRTWEEDQSKKLESARDRIQKVYKELAEIAAEIDPLTGYQFNKQNLRCVKERVLRKGIADGFIHPQKELIVEIVKNMSPHIRDIDRRILSEVPSHGTHALESLLGNTPVISIFQSKFLLITQYSGNPHKRHFLIDISQGPSINPLRIFDQMYERHLALEDLWKSSPQNNNPLPDLIEIFINGGLGINNTYVEFPFWVNDHGPLVISTPKSLEGFYYPKSIEGHPGHEAFHRFSTIYFPKVYANILLFHASLNEAFAQIFGSFTARRIDPLMDDFKPGDILLHSKILGEGNLSRYMNLQFMGYLIPPNLNEMDNKGIYDQYLYIKRFTFELFFLVAVSYSAMFANPNETEDSFIKSLPKALRIFNEQFAHEDGRTVRRFILLKLQELESELDQKESPSILKNPEVLLIKKFFPWIKDRDEFENLYQRLAPIIFALTFGYHSDYKPDRVPLHIHPVLKKLIDRYVLHPSNFDSTRLTIEMSTIIENPDINELLKILNPSSS